MSTDGEPEARLEDDVNDEALVHLQLDAIEGHLQDIGSVVSDIVRQEEDLLSGAGTVCDDLSDQLEELSSVVQHAESTAEQIQKMVPALLTSLEELDDALTGVARQFG